MNVRTNAVEAFDLEGYVQKFGAAPIKAHEWALTCPVCQKTDKLVVNTAKKNWHCWVCEEYRTDWQGKKKPVKGAGGVLALIVWMEGCTREHAVSILMAGYSAASQGASFFDFDEELGSIPDQPEELLPIPIEPPPYWQPIYGTLPYCAQRGITEEDVQTFGLVHCVAGRYRNRLIFPVWEAQNLVYYQARAMWDPQPGREYVKSLNPPKVEGALGPSKVLMNLDNARHYPRVAITEGPIDCVHAGPSAVCTFGKKISTTQIMKLQRAGVRAVDLMWDGPTESEPRGAWPEMLQAAAQLSGIFDVNLVFLPHGDPGDFTREDLDQFRASARPADSISRLAML